VNELMYQKFHEVQKKHWWFRVKKNIVMDYVKRYISSNKCRKVLDVGCGSGLMLDGLQQIGEVSGVDQSGEAVLYSKKNYLGKVKIGSLPNEIPFNDNYFNLITALDVIEHIEDDINSLRKIRDLLVDGGISIITVPAYMFLWSEFDELNMHKRRYTKNELIRKLEISGLKIIKISYYNTFLFPMIFIIRKAKKILKISSTNELKIPNPYLNKLLESIFMMEKFYLKIFSFPFGTSIIAVVKK